MRFVVHFILIIFFIALPIRAEENDQTFEMVFDEVRYFIHFPVNKFKYAEKVKKVIENDFVQLHKYFKYRPQSEVHFKIINSEAANGLALVIPRNTIELNDFPPVGNGFLNSSKDWIRSLVIHEYTHILHMEMTSGIFQFFRKIVGSTAKVNGLVPRWFSEGIAVWAESTFTYEGRLKNKTIKKIVVEKLLDKNFCQSIDCLDSPKLYPYRSFQYWAGSHFVSYIEEKYPNAISCIVKKNSEMIPFLINHSFKSCLNQDIAKLWKKFRKSFIKSNKSLVNYCPLNSGCKLISKNELNFIDWQKGYANNDYLAYAINDNNFGHIEQATTHKFTFINKKTKKTINKKLNYSIENIYEVSHDQFILVIDGNLKKEFWLYPDEKKIEYSDKIINPSYVLDDKYLVYSENRWTLKDAKNEALYKHERLKNIYKPILKENKFLFLNESKKLEKVDLGRSSEEKSITQKISSSEYESYEYLSPTYLLFMVGQFGNLNTLQTQTTLSDPLKKQRINVSLNTYFTNDTDSPYGGNLNYRYSFTDYSIGAGYNKIITKNIFLDSINTFETTSIDINKTHKFKKVNSSLGVEFSKTLTDDFISKRESENIAVSTNLNYQNNGLYDFFKGIDWGLTIFRERTIGFNEFYGVNTMLISDFSIYEEMNFYYRANYTKNFKDDYYRGIVNGGGASSLLTGNFYLEHYALSFGDLIGNEVLTSRLEFENNVKNIYRGWGTFPIYLKTFKLFYGSEYAKSDIIYFTNEIGFDEEVTSVHAGMRLTGDVAYYVPAKIELVLSKVLDNRYEGMRLLFLLQGSLF